jgi:hypothetical protein
MMRNTLPPLASNDLFDGASEEKEAYAENQEKRANNNYRNAKRQNSVVAVERHDLELSTPLAERFVCRQEKDPGNAKTDRINMFASH